MVVVNKLLQRVREQDAKNNRFFTAAVWQGIQAPAPVVNQQNAPAQPREENPAAADDPDNMPAARGPAQR